MTQGHDAVHVKEFDYSKLKLPTVSQHGLQVIEIVNATDVQFDELERAIAKDAMLTGVILKYANSPMYRRHAEVTNVRNAISILGIDNVKSTVMIATMRAYCESINPAKELIWLRTNNLATASKLIARKRFRRLSDDIELTALMSEMGALVLATNFDALYSSVIEQALENNTRWSEEEFKVIGSNRAELTRFILEKLRLPEVSIVSLVNYFNKQEVKDLTPDENKHQVILSLANKMAYAYDRQIENYIQVADKHVQLLGFSEQVVADLQCEYAELMKIEYGA